MKSQKKPESKIFTKKDNTNKKKNSVSHGSVKKFNPSLLKKNEFALILLGALLLTIIIFFFFFRSSDSKTQVIKPNTSNISFVELEKRIINLEKELQTDKDSVIEENKNNIPSSRLLKDRIARLETAFTVKFDSLIERMEINEKNISLLKNKPVIKHREKPKPKVSIPIKKAVKKKSMFHTVKKKETLYSIGKRYNISVKKLRTLNQLSKTAKIYPGDNLLVR